MRKLLAAIVILAVMYSGYWLIGMRAVGGGIEDALAQMQADGWDVTVTDVATKGFPSRFDTTLNEVSLEPPSGLWRYSAPFVQALALSYAPNKVIAVLPQTQRLDAFGQQLTITAERLRASTGVAASMDLAYQGFTAEGEAVKVASNLGWDIATPRLLLAMRQNDTGPTAYDLYGEVLDVRLGGGLQALFSGAPDTIDRIALDALVTLDRPLNRQSFQEVADAPILPTAIELRSALVRWGETQLIAAGPLEVIGGLPEGRITLTLTNWDQVIDRLVQSRVIQPGVAPTVRNMAALLSEGRTSLEVPITFDGGFMSLGPIPLGRAPRIY